MGKTRVGWIQGCQSFRAMGVYDSCYSTSGSKLRHVPGDLHLDALCLISGSSLIGRFAFIDIHSFKHCSIGERH